MESLSFAENSETNSKNILQNYMFMIGQFTKWQQIQSKMQTCAPAVFLRNLYGLQS